MDEQMRAHVAVLRSMQSEAAAEWLLQHHPSGEGIRLLEHISLRREDYRRLARHYLAGCPHAQDRAYRLFAHRLGLRHLIRILDETQGRYGSDADLLAYHLKPLLRNAKDAEELREAEAFIDRLTAR